MGKNTDNFFKEKKEWSKIKDDILGFYLKPYFTKIQYTNKDIVYIDGCAGKGRFDDGTMGSPLIAYNVFNEIDSNIKIKFYFIENKYYNDLKENVKNFNYTEVIAGNYEDNIVNLINNNSGKNLFVYIDPFGIKNLNFSYLKSLNSSSLNSAEFLMNLNSFGFIREGCRILKTQLKDVIIDKEYDSFMDESDDFKEINSVEKMNNIAGGDYWQQIIKDHQENKINGYEAEKLFVDSYCKKIRETGKFKYVINIPIRTKAGSPPKYRMVFATNHQDGVLLMNNNMANRFDDLLIIQKNGYESLFQENFENEFITSDDIKHNIISLLNDEYKNYYEIIIDYIYKFGIVKTKYLNDAIREFEKNNMIIIKREPPFTATGKKSQFISPQKNQEVSIKLTGDIMYE